MKRKFFYSQKTFLFFSYGLLFTILLSGFFIFFYNFYSENLIDEAKSKSESLTASIENSLSTELDTMSTLSMNIVYSNAIKKHFNSFNDYYLTNSNDPLSYLATRENVLLIYDIITAIIGPFQSATQINLYTLNGTCIGSGYFQGITDVNFENLTWYDSTISKNGSKNLTTINKLPNSDKIYLDSSNYLTLTRLFFNSTNDPEGIVEVIQDCNTIFSLLFELEAKNQSTSFYVYDENDNLVYPYKENINTNINYIDTINNSSLVPSIASFISTNEGNETLICYNTLDSYNWTIITSTPKSSVLESLNTFKYSFIIIIFISIFFTLLLCFIISAKITLPLSKLSLETSKITITNVLSENESKISNPHSNIKEISELSSAFSNMYDKLRESSHEVLLLKSEETKAKLQATQSLLNPHFLYNSLTNISVMAEEEMNDEIIEMCDSLCSYFRYISNSTENIISLSDEIQFTEEYINCMKIRYGDDFIYKINIADNTKNILIPKLIVQPFVENAFKHGFSISPPWHLNISAEKLFDKWIIKIEDNGGCLSDAKCKELLNSFYTLDKNKELYSMQIGGMGLKNIYLRLKLLYDYESIFHIDNSIDGKTTFIIGGPIYTNKEDFYNDHTQI